MNILEDSSHVVSLPKVLFVDDEKSILNSIKRVFRSKQYKVCTANSGKEALNYLTEQEFDVVVSDLKMPSMNGLISQPSHRVCEICLK